MRQVFADSYLELKTKYPMSFARRQERGGRWSGLIQEEKS